MSWLDVAGPIGYGTQMLLGSPSEQRNRELEALRRGENLALQREELAERKRQHDLQYGERDWTPQANVLLKQMGMDELPLGSLKGSRQEFTSIFPAIVNARKQASEEETNTLQVDPLNLTTAVGSGRKSLQVPGTGLPEVRETLPALEGAPGTVEEPPTEVVAAQAVAPRMTTPIKRDLYQSLAERMEKNRKAQTEETNTAEKQRQVVSARAMYAQTQDLPGTLAKHPLLDAKDLLGYQPASPTKPETAKLHYGTNGEIIKENPDGTWSVERKGTPKEEDPNDARRKKAAADLAEIKLQLAKDQKASAGILEDVRAGKKVDEGKIRKAVSDHQQHAQRWIKEADVVAEDEALSAEYKRYAREAMHMAAELQQAIGRKPGQPGTAPGDKQQAIRDFLRN